jgi:hypothetical protein
MRRGVVNHPCHKSFEFEGNLEGCQRHWSWFVEDPVDKSDLKLSLVLTFIITIWALWEFH